MSETKQPIVFVARDRKVCAADEGSKPNRSTARITRACNSGVRCGPPFSARLTLLIDTPAWAATSRIVGRAGGRFGALAIAAFYRVLLVRSKQAKVRPFFKRKYNNNIQI
jgi:hypothetical protein